MKNNKRVAVFLMVLVIVLALYVSSSYKMAFYNHTGKTIEYVSIESVWKNKTFTELEDNEVLHIAVFAPYKKQIRVKVKQAGVIRSVTFTLKNPLAGEKYNQVEADPDNAITSGTLGLQ